MAARSTRSLSTELLADRVFIRLAAGVQSIAVAGIQDRATGLELRLSKGLVEGPLDREVEVVESWALYGRPAKSELSEGAEREVIFATGGSEELTLFVLDADGRPVSPRALGSFRIEALSPSSAG